MVTRRFAVIVGAAAVVLARAGFGLATLLSGAGGAGNGWVPLVAGQADDRSLLRPDDLRALQPDGTQHHLRERGR
jgi:hypothetical protein